MATLTANQNASVDLHSEGPVGDAPRMRAMDGMTAAAQAAYALSDAAVIFPITPASHMAETVEAWSVAGRRNLFGQTVDVKEMQSEKGVAGCVHGCLAGGALTSSFTASQGLLLMIPNLYKVSGELLPGVFHVTCRSLSAHALSIFGDHQDVMAVRQTGVPILFSASVQECMDLSLVAHLAAIDGSLPMIHAFDGFRTSDEIETIEVIEQEAMAGLVDWDKVRAFRGRSMEPERPMVRGTAQNGDVYFQNREAPNPYHDAMPSVVQAAMDRVARLTGRPYHLFDYVGAPDAERVIVSMGSSTDVVEEVVRHLVARGERVGCVKIRLYRPFSAKDLVAAIPESATRVAALDRTKEPGSLGEPLFLDVACALAEEGRRALVVGGRYGLSSKDLTPAMVAAVFENLAADEPKRRFTVGIDDDVTHLSLAVGEPLRTIPGNPLQCEFWGFGSDGTVGANKQAAKIVGDETGRYVQCYSHFDSHKSGGLTISYVRYGTEPIHSPYLIDEADYVACHKSSYVGRYDLVRDLKAGGMLVLNCPWDDRELARRLPPALKRGLARRRARLFCVDANAIAAEVGLGGRINMIMEAVFFKLSGVMDADRALAALKTDVERLYGSQGPDVVARNQRAIDRAASAVREVAYPRSWERETVPEAAEPGADDAFLRDVFWPVERLEGDGLPVSALDPAGFAPLGTAAYEKRAVALEVPHWDKGKCIQCYQCSLVCPHASIRPYLATADELEGAPETFETVPAKAPALKGMDFRIQVYPEDCQGCGSCATNCPGKALSMTPLDLEIDDQRANLAFAEANISQKDEVLPKTSVMGSQLQQPLLEFSGACAGCGETPYVKLLTQLFGDRLIIANATGCSSIWGAYLPAMPYTTNRHGRGPAWGNSLFEDNAEFGYGIAKGVRLRRERLARLAAEAAADDALPEGLREALSAWGRAKDDPELSLALGEGIRAELAALPFSSQSPLTRALADEGEMFGKKSVWCVGGDGWAFDIDFDGLDAVLASGENLNVLVLDTEGYSNTGGELSKATQLGSVSGFSAAGKDTPKKNLGRMMMQYGSVYVAHVCFGADMQQTIDALTEAESYDGPSIVIALCPCISWGVKAGMGTVVPEMKRLVKAGYWPLYRFDPRRTAAGEDPLAIDYRAPDGSLADLLLGENRYASLALREPDRSQRLRSELAKEADRAYTELTRDVDVYRP